MRDVNVAVLQQLTVLLSDSNDFGAAFRTFLKEKRKKIRRRGDRDDCVLDLTQPPSVGVGLFVGSRFSVDRISYQLERVHQDV